MASLVVTSGKKRGKFYSLNQAAPNVIGRDENAPVQVKDEFVSRKHMQVRYSEESDAYFASDLKSRHGTFVNGNRIYEETPLAENDLLDIGGVTLLFTRQDFEDREAALAFATETADRANHAVAESTH
jgi:pSer/pThr/pTyr-binding forkhead associated (FHA) protein